MLCYSIDLDGSLGTYPLVPPRRILDCCRLVPDHGRRISFHKRSSIYLCLDFYATDGVGIILLCVDPAQEIVIPEYERIPAAPVHAPALAGPRDRL